MPPLDILHVCYGGLGGHMSVVNTLTRELSRAGITSGVVAIAPAELLNRDPAAWPDMERVELLPIAGRADLRSMVGAYRLARRSPSRIALIHTHRHASPIAMGRLLGGHGARVVTVEHQAASRRDFFANVNSASSLAWSRAVVFLTDENRARYPLRRLPVPALDRVAVIPNGIDLDRFAGGRRTPRDQGAPLILGMASRLVPGKDFDTLLRGLAVLRERGGRSVHLRLAGAGQERHRIESQARQLGLGGTVSLLGAVTPHGIPAFLDSLDAYVQSTHGETLSMSLLEAAAAGVPIVASDVSGVNSIFTNRVNALLFTDPESLAAALEEVDVLRVGLTTAARAMVQSRFSSAHMAAGYLKLLARIDPTGPWAGASTRPAGS